MGVPPGFTTELRRVGIHPSLDKILQPNRRVASPTKVVLVSTNFPTGWPAMRVTQFAQKPDPRGLFRAFLDFFVLFSGISTKSNLERTQRRPLIYKGLFLFRSKKGTETPRP
ncbi:MAG TPA: hypothetical protein VME23_14500 [Terracidiphilus sp.]|nr:hypothetical protein [Terracidiphilus sp.]